MSEHPCHEWVDMRDEAPDMPTRTHMWRIGPCAYIAEGYCATCGARLLLDGTVQAMVPRAAWDELAGWYDTLVAAAQSAGCRILFDRADLAEMRAALAAAGQPEPEVTE